MKKENNNNYIFTHLWVKGFGWENTILQPSHFDKVLKFPSNDKDGSPVFVGYEIDEEAETLGVRKLKGAYL
jgi:hypothetical protein